MCIIIDANTAHEMTSSPPHPDATPVLKWLENRRGFLVLGGKLTEELYATPFRRLVVELTRAGVTRIYRSESVTRTETDLRRSGRCTSNDLHVIALALISGARLLYSRDQRLQADFRSLEIMNNPRGHVYSSANHEHLLRDGSSCR